MKQQGYMLWGPHWWLFLPKHNLELMFRSIEPYTPRGCTFPATFFPLFVPQTLLVSPSIFTGHWKDSLHMCSQTASQSAPCSLPPDYARDRSQSSLAIQLSCWTQAFISPPTLHVLLISLLLPLSYRASFRRLLVYICSICDVIPGSSAVRNKRFL